MRILMISDVYFPRVNGVSTSIQTLRRGLSEAGHDSLLVAPAYPGALNDPTIRRVSGWAVPRDPEDRLMRPSALGRTLDRLSAADFDVVHIHTPFLAHRAGVRWGRRHDLPVVETYHTLFEGYFHHYFPWLPQTWLAFLARYVSRRQCNEVSTVVAPSSAMREKLIKYGVSNTTQVIPTGLPMENFRGGDGMAFRRRHGIPLDKPLLLYVGRVAHEKNIGFLISVLAHLRGDGFDAMLLIAGEGPALRSLKRQVAEHGLVEQVRFVGYLQRGAPLHDCYRAANVFVFASRTETQGLVLLEAMALGVPVVAQAYLGTADVLKEGEGCLVAPDDATAFAQRVGRVLSDRDLAGDLSERGRAYALEWSTARMTARMEAVYADLSGARQPTQPRT